MIPLLIFGCLIAQPQSEPNLVDHPETRRQRVEVQTFMWVQFKGTIALLSASRSPLFPLSIGLHPRVQALQPYLDIATLHPRLRFGIHSAPTELCSHHSFTHNAPAHTTFIYSGTTPSRPRSEGQPSPRRLQRARSTAKKKMLSKFPCPRNLTLVVRTKRNHSARHYNTPRARPATISVQYPPSRNGPPNAVNSAFSLMRAAFVDEPRLETKARDKRPPGHTPVHHSDAFEAFCDPLLLSNQIWKMQRQIDELIAEREKMKRLRVAAVTRAAKQMASDVRKERLLEDLIQELEESRRIVGNMS